MSTPSADPTRAKIDVTTVEAPATLTFHEISNLVKNAINTGDRLPNTPASLDKRVSRRALIVSHLNRTYLLCKLIVF